jgi:hypothetical protein
MIKMEQIEVRDEDVGGCIVRRYARTTAVGRVLSVRAAPQDDWTEAGLTVDLVLTDLPRWLPRWLAGRPRWTDEPGRIVRRGPHLAGQIKQVHLAGLADADLNFLIEAGLAGSKIEIEGDEIALQASGFSWACWTHKNLDWMCLDQDHVLRAQVGQLDRTGLSACHSIDVDRICLAGEVEAAAGEAASANFTAATAAVQVAARQMAAGAAKNQQKERERAGKKQSAPPTSSARSKVE